MKSSGGSDDNEEIKTKRPLQENRFGHSDNQLKALKHGGIPEG
jgi:hypothetical protein